MATATQYFLSDAISAHLVYKTFILKSQNPPWIRFTEFRIGLLVASVQLCGSAKHKSGERKELPAL
jgi:hypothetical protein